MPNVATVLREEITRLARKEVRQSVDPLKKSNAELRRTVASLKTEVANLNRSLQFLQKQEKRRLEKPPEVETGRSIRFSPKWVRADRQRLGLSAREYAQLVGVSSLTIYNWENGKSKPNAERLAAWAEIRGIGKREAQRRLELLSGETG
jgi:DNA-binding transcriptional regulator YiaG